MSDELFSVPEQKSPRLRWMERYGLHTLHTPDWHPGMEDENGELVFPWYAWDGRRQQAFGGDTENNALAAWAITHGVRMWFEEGM